VDEATKIKSGGNRQHNARRINDYLLCNSLDTKYLLPLGKMTLIIFPSLSAENIKKSRKTL
jgi:hypothetical protein